MRRLAVISDAHGNWHGLHAAISFAERQSVNAIHFLGDIVGYGADPNACVALMQECRLVLAGNHDLAAAGVLDYSSFNPIASEAIRWTIDELTVDSIEFIRRLPVEFEEVPVHFCHSSPHQNGDFKYVLHTDDAAEAFEHNSWKVCFNGHTHTPCVFVRTPDGSIVKQLKDSVELEEGCRYLINVGSVGQPRDGDPRACVVIFDLDRQMIKFHRIEYDIAGAQESIMDAGLPMQLAERLASGR